MLIAAFAFDYDGTLAKDGRVESATTDALQRLKSSGVKLLLVTGRELPDLQQVYPQHELFDLIVAENGALLYWPARHEQRVLAPAPPPGLVRALHIGGIQPLSIGRSIIATCRPNESKLLEAIRESKVEWQIVFNKDAVMALPSGINKASGLAAALAALEISPLNVFGVGDAENDHALLQACGYRAAVANAVDTLKQEVDLVTRADHGAGIIELIERFLRDPAEGLSATVRRHDIALGQAEASGAAQLQLLALRPDTLTLITGRSRLALLLMERILAHGLQLCVIDPEGDYEHLEKVTQLGDAHHAPSAEEALQMLQQPNNNVALNLLGIELASRPQFFTQLCAALAQLRARNGRPHWIVVDEAHHVIPARTQATVLAAPRQLSGTIFVSSEPDTLSQALLGEMRYVITVGAAAVASLRAYCKVVQRSSPAVVGPAPSAGYALFWDRAAEGPAQLFRIDAPSHEHQRPAQCAS